MKCIFIERNSAWYPDGVTRRLIIEIHHKPSFYLVAPNLLFQIRYDRNNSDIKRTRLKYHRKTF